jgi:hypothetical protein
MRLRARPPRWAALGACLAALAALLPGAARADGPKVLFVAPEPTAFSARVRAEIEAMGFDIEPGSAEIEAISSSGSIAAARVVEHPSRRIELWIVDPATGHLTLRALVLPSPDDDEASQTVRASEQLRAFFQPLRAHAAPLVAPPPVVSVPVASVPVVSVPVVSVPVVSVPVINTPVAKPPVVTSSPIPAPAPRPRFVVGADLAVPFQPGGPALHLGLKTRWMATEHLGLGGFLSIPVIGSTVKSTEGSASLTAPLLGLDVTAIANPTSRLALSASAGVALAWVRTSGFAEAPYRGQTTGVVSAAPIVGAGMAPRLTERTSLYLDGRVGIALSPVDISFAGRRVATWGRPLGVLAIGVSVDL